MPLYDADTRMLFLVGKADVGIMYWEVADKEPFVTEGLKHNGEMLWLKSYILLDVSYYTSNF